MCGENHTRGVTAPGFVGSSPRVRGKRPLTVDPTRIHGLIPARAGKTPPGPPRPQAPTAHPRVCGENPDGRQPSPAGAGSSPRVRGKPLDSMSPRRRTRLIPARAGKTHRSNGGSLRPRAHPRACGENRLDARDEEPSEGSSPRVRGKQTPDRRRLDAGRLIPACAGKTPGCGGAVVEGWAHPRVCGENST